MNPSARTTARLLLAAIASVGIGCTGAYVRQAVDAGIHGSVAGSLRYGSLDGYAQTPAGGTVGTTSRKRPTLDELGIHDAVTGEGELHLGWGADELFVDAVPTRVSGDGRLGSELISHATTFPAGVVAHAHFHFDQYRIGYEHQFQWRNESGTTLSVAPVVGVVLFAFDYGLTAAPDLSAARSYVQAAPQLGVSAAWHPEGRFTLRGTVLGWPAAPTDLATVSVRLTGEYTLWQQPPYSAAATLGIGYDYIDFEDGQRVPNHVHVDDGPLLLAGARFAF
jgi:hypothetical protein